MQVLREDRKNTMANNAGQSLHSGRSITPACGSVEKGNSMQCASGAAVCSSGRTEDACSWSMQMLTQLQAYAMVKDSVDVLGLRCFAVQCLRCYLPDLCTTGEDACPNRWCGVIMKSADQPIVGAGDFSNMLC